jgi:phage-related protein
LTGGDKFVTIFKCLERRGRFLAFKGARKDSENFPQGARDDLLDALSVVADGGTPDIAKPLKGLGAGLLEIALRYRKDAFRVVYALQLGADIWVIHAFQKKSKTGVKTPQAEIDRPPG